MSRFEKIGLLIVGAIFLACLPSSTLAQDCSFGAQANQERFGNQAQKRCEEAGKVADKAKQDQSIGEQIANSYSSSGSKYNNGEFQEHPWKGASPWMANWRKDSELLKMGMGEKGADQIQHPCARWHEQKHLKQRCGQELKPWAFLRRGIIYEGCCEARQAKGGTDSQEVWEFWRPENQFEANNFGIGASQKTASRRPLFLAAKELLVWQNIKGLNPDRDDTRPQAMKQDPHMGQSHYEGSGALPSRGLYNQYESRVIRTRWDNQRAIDYKKMADGEKEKDDTWWFGECMPPTGEDDHPKPQKKGKRYAQLHSEELLNAHWRIPELSVLRDGVGGEKPDTKLHQPLFEKALKPGIEYHSRTMQVYTGGQDPRSGPKKNVLDKETCASYRLSKKGSGEHPMDKATDNEIQANGGKDWERLCYDQALGQLYPLTGVVNSDSNTTAPLMAIRRFMRWSSWKELDKTHGKKDRKTNFMNDRQGENAWRDQYAEAKSGQELPDMLQRLNPKPTSCFEIDTVKQRGDSNHPQDMLRDTDLGSVRYAQWNRRECCMCKDPFGRFPGEPEELNRCLGEDLNVVIPWEE